VFCISHIAMTFSAYLLVATTMERFVIAVRTIRARPTTFGNRARRVRVAIVFACFTLAFIMKSTVFFEFQVRFYTFIFFK
jgi:hypothetical protein